MLTIGDKAPSFKGKDQNSKTISLTGLKGKKVVLYFYPKDDTPGCTAEACDLRDNYKLLLKKGYEVIGISADDEKSHQKFAGKYSLPFSLLSDPEHKIIESYGAWGEKNMYGRKYMGIIRKTFIIDEKGKIEDIIEKVNTKKHTEQILQEKEK